MLRWAKQNLAHVTVCKTERIQSSGAKLKSHLGAAKQTEGKRINAQQTWHMLRPAKLGKAKHSKATRNLAHVAVCKTELMQSSRAKLKANLDAATQTEGKRSNAQQTWHM